MKYQTKMICIDGKLVECKVYPPGPRVGASNQTRFKKSTRTRSDDLAKADQFSKQKQRAWNKRFRTKKKSDT